MPVFTIETPAGQKLDIEAADQASAIRGAQQWHAENSQPKGLLSKAIDFIGNEGSALRQGAANVVGGTGETLNQYGPAGSGAGLKSAADAIAPKNYVSPSVIDKEGVHASALSQAVTEMAPGLAAGIAAGRVMRGPWWAKLAAGALAGTGMTMGSDAKEHTFNRTGDHNAEPTTEDKVYGAVTAVPKALLGAVGIGRFLPGVGSVTKVGAEGLRASAAQLAKTVAVETGVGAGQDAIGQVGTTAGTPGGVSVDPYRAANAGVVQGATGGLMAAPRAAAEVAGARKYREFGGDNQAASTEVANEIQAAAGGGDNLTPGFVNAKTKEGFHAVREVADATAVELARATSELKKTTPLTPAAEGVLSRAQKGEALTARDHEILDASLQSAPNGADVAALARKASVIAKLKDQGNFNEAKEKFTGGLTPKITGLISGNYGKAAALTALAEASGSHIIAHSPQALAAVAGGTLGARILDKLTGNINPANRFAERFADPNAPLRPQAGPPLPQNGPWGPIGPGPSGPQVPLAPQKPLAAPAGMAALLAAHVRQANRDSRFEDNQTKMQAMPLLRALAAQSKMQQQAAQPEAPVDPAIAQREQMKSAIDVMSARRANARLTEQNAPPPPPAAPEAPPALNPMALPREITGPAKNLTAGMLMAAKAREAYAAAQQKASGSAQAEDLARSSPLVDAAGGLDAIRNPDMGKRASALISAANAVKKLTAQPAEEAEAPPVVTRVTKVDGKVKTQTAPAPKANGAGGAPYEEAPQRASRTSINAEDLALAQKALESRLATGVPMHDSAAVNYKKSAAQRQALHRDRLIEVSGHEHFPSENMPLMEALDKIRTEVKTPAELQAHVEDIATNHPEAAAIVRKFFGPKWANSIWHPTKKK